MHSESQRTFCDVFVTLLDEEQQNEECESQAAEDHSAQQEAEAALTVHHLREQRDSNQYNYKSTATLSSIGRASHDTRKGKDMGSIPNAMQIRPTEPTSTWSTISPIPALVTRTVVAQPEDDKTLNSDSHLPPSYQQPGKKYKNISKRQKTQTVCQDYVAVTFKLPMKRNGNCTKLQLMTLT